MNADVPRGVAYVSLVAPGPRATGRCAAASRRATSRRGFLPARTCGSAGRARLRGRRLVRHAAVSRRQRRSAGRHARRQPQRRLRVRVRHLDGRAERSHRLRRQVRALRLPRRSRACEPARQRRGQADPSGQLDVPCAPRPIARSRPAPRSSCRRRSVCGCRRSGRSRTCLTRAFRPERHDHVEVAAERKWPGASSLACARSGSASTIRSSRCSAWRSPMCRRHRSLSGRLGRRFRGARAGASASAGSSDDHLRASVDYTQADTEWRRAVARSATR